MKMIPAFRNLFLFSLIGIFQKSRNSDASQILDESLYVAHRAETLSKPDPAISPTDQFHLC